MKISVVILGAGNSKRMGIGENKVFMKIMDKYVLEYSIDTFLKFFEIFNIVVVYNLKDGAKIDMIKKKYKNVTFVPGGLTRQQSLIKGISSVDLSVDKVIIHDAARPLIYPDVLKSMIDLCYDKEVLIPVRKVIEGIKLVKDNNIVDSFNRDSVVFCQTPQFFDINIINKIKENKDKGIINFLLDLNIKIDVYYLEKNILKITTLDDIYYYDYLIRRMYEKDL